MIHLPKLIAWGNNNEPKARCKYVEYMQSIGHTGLTASDAGFVIHKEKCDLSRENPSYAFLNLLRFNCC